MEIVEFETVDNRFRFTVKHEFLKTCSEPHKLKASELMTKYKLSVYLHNPKGPAIYRLKDGMVEYWIDGDILSKEAGEKIAHDWKFNSKLEDTLNE